jgi:GTP cyclohydrolase I
MPRPARSGQLRRPEHATRSGPASTARAGIARHFRAILELLDLDPEDPNFRATPTRVADLLLDVARRPTVGPVMTTFPNDHGREAVSVRSIAVYVLCPHHFLPFFGEANVEYIPGGRIVGLSKIPRLVEHLSRLPQTQEGLTSAIADELMRTIEPVGVVVEVDARHLCLEMRGARRPGVRTTTRAVRGDVPAAMRSDPGRPTY